MLLDPVGFDTPDIREWRRVRRVPRPSIPWTISLAASIIGGTVLAEELSWLSFIGVVAQGSRTLGMLFFSAALLCGIVGFTAGRLIGRHHATDRYRSSDRRRTLTRLRGSATASVLVVGLFFSTGCGLLHWAAWEDSIMLLRERSGGEHLIEVTSDATEDRYGTVSDGILLDSRLEGTSIRIRWSDGEEALPAGTTLHAFGRAVPTRATDKGRDAHRDLRCANITVYSPVARGWAHDLTGIVGPFRSRIAQSLEAVGGPGAKLVSGILIGDRSSLHASALEDAFKRCGLAHLIAVSGSHLVVVASLLSILLTSFKIAPRPRALIAFIILGGYVALSGFQISALRSYGMALCTQTGPLIGRRAHTLSSIAIVLSIMLIVSPGSIFGLSLQLSAAAVLGIALLSSYLASWISVTIPKTPSWLRDSISMTFASLATTLPITVPLFSLLPVLSPLSNLIAAPLISLLLGAGLLAAPVIVLLGPAASGPVASLVCSLGEIVASVISGMGRIPFISLAASWSSAIAMLACVALLAIVWMAWPRPDGRAGRLILAAAGAISLILIATFGIDTSPRIVMLDVGQGDAMLISDGTDDVLIDTGPSEQKLLSELSANGVTHIDSVIITHLHDDHYGGLPALGQAIGVDTVYFAKDALGERYADNAAVTDAVALVGRDDVVPLSVGDTLTLDGFRLEVLSPRSFSDDGGNGDSLCFLITYDAEGDGEAELSMLSTGDAESEVLDELLDSSVVGDVDILKVGHHASSVALTADDLERLRCEVALISVGDPNDYGHPDPVTLELLDEAKVRYLRTDQHGDISIHLSDDGYSVM